MGFNFPNTPTLGQTYTPSAATSTSGTASRGGCWRLRSFSPRRRAGTASSTARCRSVRRTATRRRRRLAAIRRRPVVRSFQLRRYAVRQQQRPVAPNGSTAVAMYTVTTAKPSLAAAISCRFTQYDRRHRIADFRLGHGQGQAGRSAFLALATSAGNLHASLSRMPRDDRIFLGSFHASPPRMT